MSLVAITRDVSPSMEACELTHLERAPLNLGRAEEQHRAYRLLLQELGARVVSLPALKNHPDSVFVEDTAVVLPEVAVLTRPGAASRQGEVASMEAALKPYRSESFTLQAPGTLDGGDVVVLGKELFVGCSGRTNLEAIAALGMALEPFGYRVRSCEVRHCLHLKSAVTTVDARTVLLNPKFVEPDAFSAYEQIHVDPTEPAAANVLRVNDALVFSQHFPRTLDRLHRAGLQPHVLDNSEFLKAEGALTCCSLIFQE